MTEANLTDVATLRSRARQNVENGAVTEGYDADREEIIRLLNASLATELVCVLRYKRHYFMASGIKAAVAAQVVQFAAAGVDFIEVERGDIAIAGINARRHFDGKGLVLFYATFATAAFARIRNDLP